MSSPSLETAIAIAVGLVALQPLTYRSGPARRSAAQPFVFLAGLLLSPATAALVVFSSHVGSRAIFAPFASSPSGPGSILAGAIVQAIRAFAVSALARAFALPVSSAPALLLVAADLALAFVLWLAQRLARERRSPARAMEVVPLFAGEAAADLVGWLGAAAAPSFASLSLTGVAAFAIGLLGRERERSALADRHLSGFVGTGDLVSASDVEPFLESFGRSLGRVVRHERIDLVLFDEDGAPAGAWTFRDDEVSPADLPGGATAADREDLAVDTPDSFIPAALASPDALPADLTVPIVDGQRILGRLRIVSPALPELANRPRKLFETLLRQAAAVLRALRLQRLATTDPLTGLAIRRLFDLRLAETAARSRDGKPSSLVIVDVDHFKSINDRFGHPAGDEVLRRVGWILRESLRGRDLAARIGGEEFALLLPGTPSAGAVLAAERIRRRLEASEIATVAGVLRVTASFGISEIASDAAPSTSIEAADRALYRAKNEGRNRVVAAAVETPKSKPGAKRLG